MTTVTDELIDANKSYAASFVGPLPLPPARQVLGINEGDAHVIRNAGGVVTEDVLRSLAISQRLLARTRSFSFITRTAGC